MLDKSFREICDGIKKDVKDTQLEIMVNANANLVNLYYRIGKIISEITFFNIEKIDLFPVCIFTSFLCLSPSINIFL